MDYQLIALLSNSLEQTGLELGVLMLTVVIVVPFSSIFPSLVF